jgi:4'-phosphopantetheinyl transferase EntD
VIAMTDPTAVEQLLLRLAPDGTGVAACQTEASLFERLTADERVLVGLARPARRAEFAAGRSCAHRALAAIGGDTDTIGRGRRRQPVWPAGVTGSISHAAGLAAAVAAPTTPSVTALGIDVELAGPLDDELWPHVLTPSERAMCSASDDRGAVAAAVFSAKEAAFKAVYPLLGAEIDFLEAKTVLQAGTGHVEIPSLGASAAVRHGRAGPFVVSLAIVTTAT